MRLVDEVQFQRRRTSFDFDVMIGTWIASPSPGNEQRGRWSSAAANAQGAYNIAGVASPAIDAMIAAILAAESNEDFVAAVRALDRLLISGFYIVPLYYAPEQWIAYSAKLGRPEQDAAVRRRAFHLVAARAVRRSGADDNGRTARDRGANLAPHLNAKVWAPRDESGHDEWIQLMLYAVSARLIADRAAEFHKRLTDGSIAAQRPDGGEIVAAMERARVAPDGAVRWTETCYCANAAQA